MTAGKRIGVVNAGLGVLALGALFAASLATFVDPDLYHGLAYGRLLFTSGVFPRGDAHAFTPTLPVVVHHEWGLGALNYLVTTAFGAPGLVALRLAVEGGLVGGAFALACWRGARLPVLLVLGGMGLGLMSPAFTLLRAQAWTLLFTVALLWLLEFDRRGARWWIPLYLGLQVVWQNAHGGFVVGVGILALHAVEQAVARRPWHHLAGTLAAAGALVVVNPYGWEYYRYLWAALRLDRSVITEWWPLWRGTSVLAVARMLGVWAVSVLVAVYGMWHAPGGRRAGWSLLLVTALLSLRHQRHLCVYGIVWLVYVAPLVQQARLGVVVDRLWRRQALWVGATLVLVLVPLLGRVAEDPPWSARVPAMRAAGDGGREPIYPVGPVQHLRDVGFHGNVLVPFHTGGYVSWQLHPAVRISLDGRWEVAFPPTLLAEHQRFFAAARGWEGMLTRYPVDVVLTEREMPVAAALEETGGWHVVYRDDAWMLFARPGLRLPTRDRRGTRLVGSFP